MKFTPNDPPRVFKVSRDAHIELKDCGRIALNPDEQVTFVTEDGAEYDVVRKSWGFYATPSLNGRLVQFGLRAALIKSPGGKYYVMLVESGKETDFHRYLKNEEQSLIVWLDSDEMLRDLENKMKREND